MSQTKTPNVLSRGKVAAFTAIALVAPLLVIGCLEAGLRVAHYGSERALFVRAPFDSTRYLMPNPRFAARYFPGDPSPPTPPSNAFLRQKPAKGLRIFVLGESTTAGFPFPANGAFSSVVADALTDVMPGQAVEVINVGIPATSTFAIYDELPYILEQHPDAVLIYAGHNEYYGALGSASTQRLAGRPSLVRLALRLQRLKTVLLLSRAIAGVRGRIAPPAAPSISRMEELATLDTLRFNSRKYEQGVDQLRDNLSAVLSQLRDAGIPAYVGSLASNLRDQAPFASDTGSAATNAAAAFAAAHVALSANSVAAESLFAAARDLDLVRFRAPSAFNAVIRETAAKFGAHYVPVAEAFREATPDHIPGNELFFEHVHPRPSGVVLIARAFYDRLAADRFLGRAADTTRLAPWPSYGARMNLTALDDRISQLLIDALKHRWPFVPKAGGSDFLASYRPADATDSIAIQVVDGRMSFVQAKLAQAARLEARSDFTGAVAEYWGLMRHQPWNESPFRFAARAYLAANRPADARPLLERAYALEPTPFTCLALARLAATDSTRLPEATALYQQALRLGGFNPDAMYQLSLVLARQGNLEAARGAAATLYRAAPAYPGIAAWMKVLGM